VAASSAIVVRLIGDSSELRRGLDQAQTGMEKFKKRMQLAAVGLVTAGAAAGKAMVSAAAEQSSAVSAWTQVTGKQMDKQQQFIARSLSFTTLSSLYQSNGIKQFQANKMAAAGLKLAADQAAFGNTTVAEAVEAQAGLLKGSGELLEKYAISITAADVAARMKADGTDKLKGSELKAAAAVAKMALVQEQSAKFTGQAAREAGSLESRNQKLNASIEDMKAKLGAKLLPVVETFLGKLQSTADWVEQNQTKVKALGIVLGVVAGAIIAANVVIAAHTAALTVARAATMVWTGAMWLLNAAVLSNPIVGITVAVIAFVAAIVIAYKKCETFREIVQGAFRAVRNAAAAAFGWVRDNWPLLLAILTGPVGLAVLAVVKNFDRIKAAGSAVKDALVTAFSGVTDIITAPFRAAVEGIRSAWNSTIGGKGFSFGGWDPPGPGSVPGISFEIPRLAAGGSITRRGWTMVGEEGPELLNLGRGAQVVPLDRTSGGGPDTLHLTLDLGHGIQQVVQINLREHNRATKRAVLAGASRSI
jgi:hypothetical protein